MSETTPYGKAERERGEGIKLMVLVCLKGKPPLESLQVFEPVLRLSCNSRQVDQPERVGWIAIEQGIHTLLGSTGWSHRALKLKMMYTTMDQLNSDQLFFRVESV